MQAAAERGIEQFLHDEQHKSLLKFLTCGSVDDGKSTLIGRLLYDSRNVYEDQIQSVAKSSVNRSGGPLDLSLLTDGLRAEREQGITIDVAYRYFSTAKRKFILADTPGHEQFTRNMATGASTADLAIILIDARYGVLAQSRRHAYICSLLGIRHIVVAINKMDLVGYDEAVFTGIRKDFDAVLTQLGIGEKAYFMPVSALVGDNIVTRSTNMPWFTGTPLLEYLEDVDLSVAHHEPFRFPVQTVIRPDLDFRGYAGQIASGSVKPGDRVAVWPSGRQSRVSRIVTFDGDLAEAAAPQSVVLTLEDEVDIARGDLLTLAEAEPTGSRRFLAHVVWMQEAPLDLSRGWIVKHGARQVKARVIKIEQRVDVNTLATEDASSLGLNDIGVVELELASALFFDSYRVNRGAGGFILIDVDTNATAGAGMIMEAVEPVFRELSTEERAARYGHHAKVLRLGGRLGVAKRLERRVFDRGGVAVVLDGASSEQLSALQAAGVVVLLVNEPGLALPQDDAVATESLLDRLWDEVDPLIEGEGI